MNYGVGENRSAAEATSQSGGQAPASGSAWVDRQTSYHMDTPKLSTPPVELGKMVVLLGLHPPDSSEWGHVTRSHQWDEQKECVHCFWAGEVKSLVYKPRNGLVSNVSVPILAQREPQGKEAQANDQDLGGGCWVSPEPGEGPQREGAIGW